MTDPQLPNIPNPVPIISQLERIAVAAERIAAACYHQPTGAPEEYSLARLVQEGLIDARVVNGNFIYEQLLPRNTLAIEQVLDTLLTIQAALGGNPSFPIWTLLSELTTVATELRDDYRSTNFPGGDPFQTPRLLTLLNELQSALFTQATPPAPTLPYLLELRNLASQISSRIGDPLNTEVTSLASFLFTLQSCACDGSSPSTPQELPVPVPFGIGCLTDLDLADVWRFTDWIVYQTAVGSAHLRATQATRIIANAGINGGFVKAPNTGAVEDGSLFHWVDTANRPVCFVVAGESPVTSQWESPGLVGRINGPSGANATSNIIRQGASGYNGPYHFRSAGTLGSFLPNDNNFAYYMVVRNQTVS
ncbi:MAG: hypothetical protein HC914_16185 [Chloroflexaceae bacterium]|nr:hypothetical protein [Chloroflexaceae bacterium]